MTNPHPWDVDPVSVPHVDRPVTPGEALEEDLAGSSVAAQVALRADEIHVARLLEDLGTDPGSLAVTIGQIRGSVTAAVRTRSDARRAERVKLLGGEDPKHTTDIRLEVVGACDDADVLEGFAGAFAAGAKEARGIAGDLVHELPGRGGRPRASLKVGDGKGFELSLTRSQRRELSVDVDEIVDVIAATLIGRLALSPDDEGVWTPDDARRVEDYSAGIRDGISELRDVLSTAPTFRSSALDALVKKLEDREEDPLARRLRKAYGRVDVGEASVKVDRKPLRRDDSEEPTP